MREVLIERDYYDPPTGNADLPFRRTDEPPMVFRPVVGVHMPGGAQLAPTLTVAPTSSLASPTALPVATPTMTTTAPQQTPTTTQTLMPAIAPVVMPDGRIRVSPGMLVGAALILFLMMK